MVRQITKEDVFNLRDKLLNEYDFPAGLNDCKYVLQNFDTFEEQFEYLKKMGVPAVGFPDGMGWKEHMTIGLKKERN